MKTYPLLVFACIVGMIVVGQGCKEDPSSVGLGLLASGELPRIQIATFNASSYSTVPTKISTIGSDRLLVGEYQGYTAMSILEFTGLPVGVLDTVNITDAYVQLHPVYHFGLPVGALSFVGYRMIANSDSATYDSLTTLASKYYSPNPILTFQRRIMDDTTTIQCFVDTGVVHRWFSTDTTSPNNGFILIPTSVGTIKGFGSFVNGTSSYHPTLVVDYTKNGVTGSISYSAGTSRFIANIDQSTLVATDPQSMFTQSGVAYRAQLEFNLRSLPKAGLILKASLELTFNPLPSNLNSYAADSLYAFFVKTDSTIASLPVEGQTLTAGANKIYRFDVGNYVRAWANGDTLQKLQFGGVQEINSLDLFALFGTLSPVGVRPRLILTSVFQ